MIVLRSPKGWTGPKEVHGHKVEGIWRAHQVPMATVRKNPAHLPLSARAGSEAVASCGLPDRASQLTTYRSRAIMTTVLLADRQWSTLARE